MLNEKEIEKRLKDIPKRLCVAFAARSVLRILPLLAAEEKNQDPFWYWIIGRKSKHLLGVLGNLHYGLTFSVSDAIAIAYGKLSALTASGKNPGIDLEAALSRIASAKLPGADADTASKAVFNASITAGFIHHAYYPDHHYGMSADSCAYEATSAAVKTISAAASVSNAAKEIVEKSTLSDLELIKGKARPGFFGMFVKRQTISPMEFLETPLWPSGEIPEVLAPQWKRLCEWMNTLDEGFEFWLDWYRDRLAGKTLDLDLLEKQVKIPAEIARQGSKAVNAYLMGLKT